MVSGWTIFFGIVAFQLLLLFVAKRRESSEPVSPEDEGSGMHAAGPLVLLKTQWGIPTLHSLARRPKVARRAGDVFLALTILGGVIILALLVFQLVLTFQFSEQLAETPPRVRDALLIPGVNPAVPVGYGIMALLVALIIHEGGHGVLAIATGMGVRSVGLVLFGIPVGAFVEPDERKMLGAGTLDKLRMFAAGPGPNLVLALVCILLFSTSAMPAMEPVNSEGVAIWGLTEGLPADEAGIPMGAIITAIRPEGGTAVPTPTVERMSEVLNNSSPDRRLTFIGTHQGVEETWEVDPIDRGDYYQEQAPELYASWMDGRAFVGIVFLGPDGGIGGGYEELRDTLANPYRRGFVPGTLDLLARPFAGFAPLPDVFHDVYEPTGGHAWMGDGYWVYVDSLYFLFWVNVLLGTFNAIPLGFLDGGQMLRATMTDRALKRRNIDPEDLQVVEFEGRPQLVSQDEAVQEKLDEANRRVDLTQSIIAALLLAMLLFPFIFPRLI